MKATARSAKQQLDRDLAGYSFSAAATLASPSHKAGKSASWAAIGAATSVALLGATGVEAAIVHSGPQNIVIGPLALGAGGSSVQIDIDGGGSDVQIGGAGGFSNPGSASQGFVQPQNGASVATAGVGTQSRPLVRKFSSGNLIGTPGSSLGPGTNSLAFFNIGGSTIWVSRRLRASETRSLSSVGRLSLATN